MKMQKIDRDFLYSYMRTLTNGLPRGKTANYLTRIMLSFTDYYWSKIRTFEAERMLGDL